jgi:hypothetical protein
MLNKTVEIPSVLDYDKGIYTRVRKMKVIWIKTIRLNADPV